MSADTEREIVGVTSAAVTPNTVNTKQQIVIRVTVVEGEATTYYYSGEIYAGET